jgi:hypothetical protein
MIAACAVHVPMPGLPAHVQVVRGGETLAPSTVSFLGRDDEVRVSPGGLLTFSYAGNGYRVSPGRFRLTCRQVLLGRGATPRRQTILAMQLLSGRVRVSAGPLSRRALVVTDEMLTLATHRGTTYVVDRNPGTHRTRAWTLNQLIVAASAGEQTVRINARFTYAAIADHRGLRLNVWPFSIKPAQRRPSPVDGLVPYWADGQPCAVGCRPPGAIPGWPLKPFHQQHAVRSGLNELRPANFHIGIDIEGRNGQAVYPIESGRVQLFDVGTQEEHVQVGRFQYWHIHHLVSPGQYAVAYRTDLGKVLYDARHIALIELSPQGARINPLRPGHTLSPYTDTEPPVIGTPRVFAGGRVMVGAFDPQSFVQKAHYLTPVLAPAALAWRLFSAGGRPLTGLQWALRGTENYPPSLKPAIFAPGTRNPGYLCFAFRRVCIPTWNYWLAGGLTVPLPVDILGPGRYRLSVYAWDWAGNASALDDWITLPLAHAAVAPAGPIRAAFDIQ